MPNIDNYNTGMIYTDIKDCIDCNKCIHECPILKSNVNAMDGSGNYKICVDEQECILCGTCLDTCVHDVRHYKDDCEAFISDVENGKPFSVIIAPAFFLNYPKECNHVLGYLKSLGVNKFYAVGFGADITVWGYLNYINNTRPLGNIAQPCPSIVSHIEKHLPELLPNLIPIQSPMMCTAIYLKKYEKLEDNLAFLSPCVSKGAEIKSKRGMGLISHNVTFKNLMSHIRSRAVVLKDYPQVKDEIEHGMGALFPAPGGLSENMKYYMRSIAPIIQVDGERDAYDYLNAFATRVNESSEYMPMMIDILNCGRGCSFGTGTEFRHTNNDEVQFHTFEMRKKKFHAMRDKSNNALLDPAERLARLNEIFSNLDINDFKCEYGVEAIERSVVTEEEIDEIFKTKLMKLSGNEQHVDCSACGYKTCRHMAEAIALGINRHENCVYFVKDALASSLEELSASKKSLQAMLDSSPLLCNLFDENFNIVDSSFGSAAFFGIEDKSDYLTRFFDFSPEFQPDGAPSKEKAITFIKKAFDEGSAHLEWIHQTAEGELVPVDATLTRITIDGDKYIIAHGQDLREHYKKEELEAKTKQMMQAIVDTSPLACAVFDENFNIIEVNAATLKLHHLSDAKSYVENFMNLCPKYQPCGMLSSEKMPIELKRGFELGRHQIEWMHQTLETKEPVPVDVSAERVLIGDMSYLIVYARDLRDFYKYKMAEEKAQQRLQAMLDSSPLLCAIVDENANILEVNAAAVFLFEVNSIEEYCKNFYDFSPEIQPDGVPTKKKMATMIDLAFQTGRAHFEWMHQTRDEKPIPCDVFLERVVLGEKNVVLAYVWDLREQKYMVEQLEEAHKQTLAAEIAQESNRAKSRFLARMSHEIRTPISAVLGISEIQLQNPSLSPQIEESFAKIHNSAGLLLGIINDILDLSKIESGKMELHQEEYYLASVIRDVTSVNLAQLKNKNIKFSLQIDENMPAQLIGDALRIEQVLNNVLSNAFKYTNKGLVEMIFECKNHNLDGYTLFAITIKDTGIGMSKKQLDAIYNEYTRFNIRKNRRVGGTGLGMPIVYNLLQLMNATIELESNEGVGTTVTIQIPQKIIGNNVLGPEIVSRLQQFDENAHGARFTFVPESMPYGKVLVVDDVEANLYVAKGLLAFYDLNIETCNDGFEAIKKIDAGNEYDLIFMDHMMPGIDGTETMIKLRRMGYTRPIVVLTANALIGQAEEFIKSGFDGFISKPIQTKSLNSILNKHIRDKQPIEVLESVKSDVDALTRSIEINNFQSNEAMIEKLRSDFVRIHSNIFNEISDALKGNEIKTAHRLAHTLKGLAGLIKEPELAQAAQQVEKTLMKNGTPTKEQIKELKDELEYVLGDIGLPDSDIEENVIFSKEKAKQTLDNLDKMLVTRNAESLDLLDEIRKIPDSCVLVTQVENFDFAKALKTLHELRAKLMI